MTGADLRAHRRAAGLTQGQLAKLAGIGRHAASYWECKPTIDLRGWAVARMAKALGPKALPDYPTPSARAGQWAVSGVDAMQARLEAQIAARLSRMQEKEAQRLARCRVICEAKTRAGMTCRNMSEPGKRRCKFHGGKSTGPKTVEGRARIAEAQRQRWARWRESGLK